MVKAYDADYEFERASQFDMGFRKLSAEVTHPRIKALAIAFQRNIERIISMHALPIEVIHWASFSTRATSMARSTLGLRIDAGGGPPELANEILKAHAHLFSQMYEGVSPEESANRAWRFGGGFLKDLIRMTANSKQDDFLVKGIESILSSMLLAAHVSFESLAIDVWVELVNSDETAACNWVNKNPDKNLKMSEPKGQRFDLKGKFGTFLQLNKLKMQSLKGIRKAYKDAFGGAADACFDPPADIEESSQVRHLLAHRAGLIDEKFKKAMHGNSEYATQEIDSYLKVSGPMVARITKAPIRVGVNLIMFAEARLKAK